ncbi:MAG: ferrous iron transporter B, partial [Propionibacteriaceae bacterium]|nr:ferrous iron transporter B [Propionibacteriaceae bacterium]
MSSHCGPADADGQGRRSNTATDTRRFSLIGSPNSGKTTLFNALTGLRAKTGNYPGVTVSRFEGRATVVGHPVIVEDLPGTYSLDPISLDERVVTEVLDPEVTHLPCPDALIFVADVTTLRRSLSFLAQVLCLDLPTVLVLSFTDELATRNGRINTERLAGALGVPVLTVTAGAPDQLGALHDLMADPDAWSRPPIPPPTDPAEVASWIGSVLTTADYHSPEPDPRTRKIDRVLLHPVWGTLVFLAVMFSLFQAIFTLATPLMDLIESLFAWLGGLASAVIPGIVGRFVSEALIGGVGGVMVFLPQIMILFFLISLLEASGYMSRAAFVMDRLMRRFGLEGRAFVALLSALACAVPGIMATRTLPSAKDRIATMLAAPLMTCSARLPVYVLLIGLLVPDQRFGPVNAQGLVLMALYLGGATAAMLTAALFSRITGRGGNVLPFYMEMPPYRLPSWRATLMTIWDSARLFLRKVGTIILITTALLWAALNLPAASADTLARHGVDPTDQAAVTAYTIDNSVAATVGKAIEPVFAPLGFDWRVNVGVVSSLAAREVFVATMGQIAAADNPEEPLQSLRGMTHTSGPHAGEPVFTPGTVAALLVFFMFALQCFATIAVMRRESGGWRWPAI